MEYISIRVSDLIRQINRDLFLPAIQRELVWKPDRIERLFDSIMSDFPIGSFLFWKLEQEHKNDWPIYEFIRQYDEEKPHNPLANMSGIMKDILLVLDGQQRIASLFVGLRGSYRFFYYRWKKMMLYLNLLKSREPDEDNPEELTYGFSFRENDEQSAGPEQLWYPVGRILDFQDAEDAKSDMRGKLAVLSEDQKDNANKLIGRLHNRIHTHLVGNYYEEKSQDYDKVLQVFVRANSGGVSLDYSDLLLATATAKWNKLDARKEIHNFTDSLNGLGVGFRFRKDFVLKACLYLCETLPIQYKVKNFNQKNLFIIEDNWENIKDILTITVRLISRFGFTYRNVVAPLALLPIAFYLLKQGNRNFDTSSFSADVEAQDRIRKWFVFSTLKRAFSGSSDTTLNRLRVLLKECSPGDVFPADHLYKSLDIEPSLNDGEIDRILEFQYQGRYTNLVLSLLYPDRYWKDTAFHADHIFPKCEFNRSLLRKRGYDDDKVERYMSKCDSLCNLQLLSEGENLSKHSTPFDEWISTRDDSYRSRHLIPGMKDYGFDLFEEFIKERAGLIISRLRDL